MEPTDLPADAAATIAGWLAEDALDPSYLAFVARHLAVDDASWRWCCGSACDPCVMRLGRVVDRARQLLGNGTTAPREAGCAITAAATAACARPR